MKAKGYAKMHDLIIMNGLSPSLKCVFLRQADKKNDLLSKT